MCILFKSTCTPALLSTECIVHWWPGRGGGARFTRQKGGKIAACVTQPVPHKTLCIRMYKNTEIENIDDVTSDVQ